MLKGLKTWAARFGNDDARQEVTAKSQALTHFRQYNAAQFTNMTAKWRADMASINKDLLRGGPILRSRSRDLEQNNGYARRFLGLCESNIVGPDGIKLAMRVRNRNGNLDKGANKAIEEAWQEWCEDPLIDGGMSFADVERLAVRSAARDGGILLLPMIGQEYGPFGFKLRLLEIDYLDDDLNFDGINGRIYRGIEIDQVQRPVAYHLLSGHPGEDFRPYNGRKHNRIDAQHVIHVFRRIRAGQIHGEPWMAPTMLLMRMLEGFREAEAVAARVSSSKMGMLKTPFGDGEGYGELEGDDLDEFLDEMGARVMQDLEPGVLDILPPGMEPVFFDPKHPNTGVKDFQAAILQGIAMGLEVAYESLSGDYAGQTYSSGRLATLDERDRWRRDQKWLAGACHTPVFKAWLPVALLSNRIGKLSAANLDKYMRPSWRGRGWAWVDPQKDGQGAHLLLSDGLTSPRRVAAQRGEDYSEILEELKEDIAAAEQAGVPLSFLTEGMGGAAQPQPNEGSDDGKED